MTRQLINIRSPGGRGCRPCAPENRIAGAGIRGSNGPFERRATDRRGVRGRRQSDNEYACYSAQFVAHCLSQFSDETTHENPLANSAAQQAYGRSKRRC